MYVSPYQSSVIIFIACLDKAMRIMHGRTTFEPQLSSICTLICVKFNVLIGCKPYQMPTFPFKFMVNTVHATHLVTFR